MSGLPDVIEVLVIGAGPAGSACAWQMASAGRRVVLVDQHEFPRDKVCGDGLIPDAHAALRRIGVLDEVMAHARRIPQVRCIAPRGGFIDVPGSLAVLPRRELDHILLRAAVRAGAVPLMPARFEALLTEGGHAVGARLRRDGAVQELYARRVVLATGAVPQAMLAAGMCERRTPSGVALRGYVRHAAMAEGFDRLEVVWHPRLRGGYGWIFPGPDGVFNIGTGLTGSHEFESGSGGRMKDVNLREMFSAFCDVHPAARELAEHGQWVGDLKGAPLRCSLGGAQRHRPGLLATGEAIGSTYSFTGEGIGKAMETGLLAAEAMLHGGEDDAAVARHYAQGLAALEPKFSLYEKASHVNHRPWLVDLVVWRARRSPRILRRMTGVLEETTNPGRLLSWRGLTRLMFE